MFPLFRLPFVYQELTTFDNHLVYLRLIHHRNTRLMILEDSMGPLAFSDLQRMIKLL